MSSTMIEEALPATIPLDYPVEVELNSIDNGRTTSVKRPREDDEDELSSASKIPKLEENTDDDSSHVLMSTSSSAPSATAIPEESPVEEEDIDEDYFEREARLHGEVLESKYPFKLVTIPSTDPELRDIHEVQFHMNVDQIELLERDHFEKDDDDDDEQEKKSSEFKFVHFPGQFWLVNSKREDEDEEDDDYYLLDSDEEEERRRRPSSIADIADCIRDDDLRRKWIDLARGHEFEKKNRLAKSLHPKENAWFQEKEFREYKMVADSSECKVKSLLFNPTWDRELQYRIEFSDRACTADAPFKGITEHMAICALEQILREKAPYVLRRELHRFLWALKKNCTNMASRVDYIYEENDKGEEVNDDFLIGDLVTIEKNDQDGLEIVKRLNCISECDGEYEVTLSGVIVD